MIRFFIFIIVVAVTSSLLVAGEQDVRILTSDRNGVTLEYVPVFQSISTIKHGASEYQHVTIRGAVPVSEGIAGEPRVYQRSLTLQFPGVQGNAVEIIKADYEDTYNITLEPVPSFQTSDAGPLPVFTINDEAYRQNSFVPDALANVANVGETRGAILGDILISPFQYNPATKTLRKYTRILVRVMFGNGEQVRIKPDNLLDGIALNEEVFKHTATTERSPRSVSALHQSVLASGTWFSFTISTDGMYKISGSALLAAGIPSSTNPINIQLYNNGGYELPLSVTESYPDDLNEVAVYTVDANSNSQLDADDYILFYGKGVRGWNYNHPTRSFSHYINHFTETNVYWITSGTTPSKQMGQLEFLTQPAAFQPVTVGGKFFREDEKLNVLGSGLEWLGQQFNVGDAYSYTNSLPGLDVSQPVRCSIAVGAQSKGYSYFTLYEHTNSLMQTTNIGPTYIDSYGYYYVATNPGVQKATFLPTFTNEQSILRFVFNSTNANGYGFLNWFELFYQRFPRAQGNIFTFHAHDTTTIVRYRIPGYSANHVYVFDVTRFDSVLINTQPSMNVDTCSFTVTLDSGKAREFYAVGNNNFQTIGQLQRMQNQDLHGDTTEAEEIIVANSEFLPAALKLKAHRERAGNEHLRALIVTIDQIYNEFGAGLPSPRAVRNYIRYVYTNWSSPPKYLLLFGDGDFDYRGILSQRSGKIPVWETGTEFHPIYSYATDDDFVIFNTSSRISMGVGRIPAQSLSEATAVVDKIIEYETNQINDPWKFQVTMVADDGWTGATYGDGYGHAGAVESLARNVPEEFQVKKIFLHEYPTVFTANGRRKPAVNVAIRNQIHSGTAVLNFTGHGNPRLWTHEQVFVRETDFSLLSNKGKYFFLVAATCNYGAMDMASEQSGGELLMLLPEAGAIATYCATRPVFPDDNADLNDSLYKTMFAQNSFGQIIPRRLGDIVYKTRQKFSGTNSRKYVLLGDPAVRIAFPQLLASVDSINGISLAQPAQLQALSNSSLVASVRDTANNLMTDYSGTGQVMVFDAERTVEINDPDDGRFVYKTDGNVIFRGSVNVDSGKVKTRFIVPKDISYTNDYGRVMVYFSNESSDGAGFTTNVKIGGTDSTAGNDTEGPAIRIYLDSRTFRSGDVVSGAPLLIADLEDEHGINTSGAGIGHRIETWLDDSPQSIDLTAYYKSNLDSYRQGAVEYSLGELTPGTHKIRMRAWDTYNNSRQTETVFDVVNSVGLQVTHVFNFPNPFSSSTVFSIEHNQFETVDAEVKIFTVAGRLIQTLETQNINSRIVNIPWDGRDRDGDQMANGIYLYKTIVKTSDRRLSGEAYGKLSVLK